jgi:CubicO group peptidase (beta-lactamase class C family)
MPLLRRPSLALLVLALVGCASSSSPPPPPAASGALATLVDDVRSGRFGEVGALLVARGDELLAEQYFRGQTRDAVVPVYSVTKSVTSLLAGLAIADGGIASPAVPLLALLPDQALVLRADPWRERITLRDLLTMQAGIAWDEFAAPYDDPRNPVVQLLQSPDWVAHVLARPMARPPGEAFAYNSGATVVLGEAVARAVGRPLREYAQERLFAPLAIPASPWHHGPGGVANAGSGLSLRAVDLLALGRLVRDGGRAGATPIVPAWWIEESTAPATSASLGTRYGYQWWRLGPDVGFDPARPVIAAIGWGGQAIVILPEDRLVAVTTASNFATDALAFTQELARRLARVADESK